MEEQYPLTVSEISRAAIDAVLVRLVPRLQDACRFRKFSPGQHLTIHHTLSGEQLYATYGLCSLPGEGLLIGVRQLKGDTLSSFINSDLRAGDTLQATRPGGSFHLPLSLAPGEYLVIAIDEGIVPSLPIVRSILGTHDQTGVTLIYQDRSPYSMMLVEQLAALKDTHMERLRLVSLFAHEPQSNGFHHNQLDAEMLETLGKHLIAVPSIQLAFVSAPESGLQPLIAKLINLGLAETSILSQGTPKTVLVA